MPSQVLETRYNGSALGGVGSTTRGLTHSSDLSREGLAVNATQLPEARKPRQPFDIPDRVALRALRRFAPDATTGCHVSTYSVGSHGYAQVGWQDAGYRQVVTAHRAAWVAVFGQIPEGMTVDHTCRNRRCVNVGHLRLLSNFENARRTAGRDWPLGECINGHSNEALEKRGSKWRCGACHAPAPAKPKAPSQVKQPGQRQPRPPRRRANECHKGHEFTPENTYNPPSRPGERWCRECMRSRESRRLPRKRVGSGADWRWETSQEVAARTITDPTTIAAIRQQHRKDSNA